MAVKRALVFRVGIAGPTCAASEVAIEKGTLSKPGSLRPIGACTKPATAMWKAPDGSLTGLCVEHRDQVQRSSSIGAIDVQRRRGAN